jgi:hypothetical protein
MLVPYAGDRGSNFEEYNFECFSVSLLLTTVKKKQFLLSNSSNGLIQNKIKNIYFLMNGN